MSKVKQLKITFLGTGTSTGVPMITSTHPVSLSDNPKDKRLRSSIMISWDETTYIIDSGPDFRQQMIRENVQAIEGILFTHEHSDHIAGFDDIRPFSFRMGEVPIYLTERVLHALEKRYDYIFATENRYPGAAKVKTNIISKHSTLNFKGVKVVPVEVMHGNLPVLGFRFNNFAYLTDIKTISLEEKTKLSNLDTIVVTGLRKEEHSTHFNIEEALEFIKELNPKKAYLTHISELLGFHDEVEKELPENVHLAYDGLSIISE
ncbi:phosphoribosyl 1,2-cyclic phosphate phosphodiesterase [Tenacibaculum sp. MAR_2009_124]|uniref:MBL fold metallo-hydrolase n=1 Tax=Tenacibaculum sp. MAR_2009_124 TaxID=1250059 RepID=UPI0008982BAA|nr:MBL fold metallo-hydrolase [Tenacibaculum sp. MAR_2009_124]SEC91301.1 phosphoribosyl 1,2-cyclic phosphate phosphodiesterase [Tenacibaculum sp. MAR_2009_124]